MTLIENDDDDNEHVTLVENDDDDDDEHVTLIENDDDDDDDEMNGKKMN